VVLRLLLHEVVIVACYGVGRHPAVLLLLMHVGIGLLLLGLLLLVLLVGGFLLMLLLVGIGL
jgi:hypothetical protein